MFDKLYLRLPSLPMNEIKITNDGHCPQCAGANWRLARDLYAESSNHDASVYTPPSEPAEYWSKNNRLINCQRRVNEAPKVKNCLWLLKEKFEGDRQILLECQTYEKNKILWEKARVCDQCGAWFVTEADSQLATASFDVPEWPPCV